MGGCCDATPAGRGTTRWPPCRCCFRCRVRIRALVSASGGLDQPVGRSRGQGSLQTGVWHMQSGGGGGLLPQGGKAPALGRVAGRLVHCERRRSKPEKRTRGDRPRCRSRPVLQCRCFKVCGQGSVGPTSAAAGQGGGHGRPAVCVNAGAIKGLCSRLSQPVNRI